MSEIKGGRFVYNYENTNQGLVTVKPNEKLANVSPKYFTPKHIGCFTILETKQNNFNSKSAQNWKNAKLYAKQAQKQYPPISKVIDIHKNVDTSAWRGTQKSTRDFFRIAHNEVQAGPYNRGSVFTISYIDYEKDTKDVIKNCPKSMTVGEFVNSTAYKSLIDYAKRNSQKFAYDIAARMGFFVRSIRDNKAHGDVGKPKMIKFDHEWILNEFVECNNTLYCYHNTIPVKDTTDIININKNKIKIHKLNAPSLTNGNLGLYRVFDNEPGNFNIFNQNKETESKVNYFNTTNDETKNFVFLQGKNKFTDEVKDYKKLTVYMAL